MTQPPSTIIQLITTIAIITLPLLQPTTAFTPIPPPTTPLPPLTMCPGGWGIGTPNDMQEGEFSPSSNTQRRRRRKDSAGTPASSSTTSSSTYIEDVAYAVRDEDAPDAGFEFVGAATTASFADKVRREKEELRERQRKDLMEVARMAGLGERVRPKANVEEGEGEGVEGAGERLGSFGDDLMEEDGGLDSLDVRVKFD